MMGSMPLINRGGDKSMVLTTWGYSEKAAVCKPGRGPSLGTELASTLILVFPTSKTVRNQSLLFKPPSLWYFVIAA